jgi:4-amino-4-deoxy-L-arabinose transferase-like glycosyltransferase
MKINLKTTSSLSPYYLIIGLFLIVISPAFLSDGMFMDGLIYSTLSHNLANGLGNFWNPYFSETFAPDFHEHPPLLFGIQSVFYFVFGDSRYIEKIYSFLTFIIVGIIILRIWKQLSLKNGWLPLLIWILIPLNFWACPNNMLENTLSVFIALSVLFYLKSQKRNTVLYIFLSGFTIFLGSLTKGFVAFFPWSLPFIFWLFTRQKSFWKTIIDSILLITFTLLPLIILLLVSDTAYLSLQKYINIQVINSLQNVKTVETRFFIVGTLFLELLLVIGLSIILMIWTWRQKISLKINKEFYKPALIFFLLGLAGVLPIMVSMKQRSFYILATLPYFAIAIGILVYPLIERIFNKSGNHSKKQIYFFWIARGILAVGIVMTLFFANKIGREENTINDTYAIISKLPKGEVVNILPSMMQDYSLHGYFARYKNISLDSKLENERQFMLIQINNLTDSSIIKNYEKVDLQTKEFQLFKRK